MAAVNHERLIEIRNTVFEGAKEPRETSELVKEVADHLGLNLSSATSFFLTRATVLAALSSLEKAGHIVTVVEDNRLLWQHS